MNYKIYHPTKIVNCEIDLPSSKSISNRLLIINSLCKKNIQIQNLSKSEDTKVLMKALEDQNKIIDVKHAGTSFRFLTALLALKDKKEFILTGSDRLKERPIKELVKVLIKMGANIKYIEKEGFAPIKILGTKLNGGFIDINGEISSQFISAILLIAPILKNGIKLKIIGDIVSRSYILMTLKLMSEFNIKWTWSDNIITIKKQDYREKKYSVESDWSAASFWFQIASLSKNCSIRLNRLRKDSIQGDKAVIEIFNNLGVETCFSKSTLILNKNSTIKTHRTYNLNNYPDLYQPLSVTLFARNIKSSFTGITTLKNKETDRLKAVTNELKKLSTNRIIETYKDHRMAMSFAPLCLKFGEIEIKDVKIVSKSYPNFWNDLKKGGFTICPLTD